MAQRQADLWFVVFLRFAKRLALHDSRLRATVQRIFGSRRGLKTIIPYRANPKRIFCLPFRPGSKPWARAQSDSAFGPVDTHSVNLSNVHGNHHLRRQKRATGPPDHVAPHTILIFCHLGLNHATVSPSRWVPCPRHCVGKRAGSMPTHRRGHGARRLASAKR